MNGFYTFYGFYDLDTIDTFKQITNHYQRSNLPEGLCLGSEKWFSKTFFHGSCDLTPPQFFPDVFLGISVFLKRKSCGGVKSQNPGVCSTQKNLKLLVNQLMTHGALRSEAKALWFHIQWV